MKIAILGAGNMGGAIARGLVRSAFCTASDIALTDRVEATLQKASQDMPGITVTASNLEAVTGADLIIPCVKPWLVASVIDEIRPELIQREAAGTSPLLAVVAAGVTFAMLDEMTQLPLRMARVIPNTAISLLESPTLLNFNARTTADDRALLTTIFDKMGRAIVIDEAHMAAGTAVTSCGIAYALEYIKAAIQGAIELGFYPAEAKKMIDQTVKGAISLLDTHGSMPDEEIYKVCTPGGITIKGLNEMTRQGFDNAVILGLKAAAGQPVR